MQRNREEMLTMDLCALRMIRNIRLKLQPDRNHMIQSHFDHTFLHAAVDMQKRCEATPPTQQSANSTHFAISSAYRSFTWLHSL